LKTVGNKLEMTKQQSILLDILLNDFSKPEYQGNEGMVNVENVVKGNKKLKNISESELNELLYIIRKEQLKIGIQLLSGTSIFVVFESHIKDFLNIGGFKKLRVKKRNELYFKWIGFIITILTFIILIYSTFFQENVQKAEAEQISKPQKEKIELQVKTTVKIDLTKVPDSLELITEKKLTGDFNGDNKMDFASVVKNKNDQKSGVLIIHNSKIQENFVFGAGKEIDNMTDLNWIEIFKVIPKGEIVAPELVDEETGDLLGPDQSQNFKLIGNGIYMSVTETHGGGIIFWNGKEYQWYRIE
jgi:hypothetical protein